VALERRTLHFPDILLDPEYQWMEAQQIAHFRTVLGVPMLREGTPLGVFFIWREEVIPFTDKQIELVTTFADQAVIAIENLRLLQELQTRTGELARSVEELKVLGEVSHAVSSTLDLATVLDTIVARAVQLSAAYAGLIYEYDEVAQEFHLRGSHRIDPELLEVVRDAPMRLGEGATGKSALLRAPVQVPDVLEEGAYDVARIRDIYARRGYRALLAVPLLTEQRIVGALVVWRQEPGAFTPEVVRLLETFAAQPVLAIENARLFHELADKSRQLEVASQHKSEFLASMSHELRMPLNAIIGFSEVLLEQMFGGVNPKQTEYLHDILESGRHLLSLINDILDLSKIEAGRMELDVSDFDLPGAIENALILVRDRAARRGIRLEHAIDRRLGPIRADERKVKQVLLNLLSNALKFTPEGGRIEVRAQALDGVAEVAVADTGIGIAPEDQAAVFEEFRQVGSADRKAEGTGLGLALARKFIELHGGKIWVTSQVGVGSTFGFTLPR
jgi:signal transduction histidine kinase